MVFGPEEAHVRRCQRTKHGVQRQLNQDVVILAGWSVFDCGSEADCLTSS